MKKYEIYDHHGWAVYVRADLKGKHRKYCLCFDCKSLNLDDRDENCPIANELFDFCTKYGTVTPVWECRLFEVK